MRYSRSSLVAVLLTCTSSLLFSQTSLRNMPGPQGGTIIYGTVDGANTPPAAMGSILKQLHTQYGERPVVGRVFKVRGTDSDAVFFTLTPHVASMKPVAGMLLVSNVPGHVEAALLSDDASRFGTSINPMLQTLFSNWKPGGKSLQASNQNGPANSTHPDAEASGPIATLHPYRLPDSSATVMLADGWHVSPQSGGGTIIADGPNGEKLALGFPYLAHNTNDPRTQQMQRFAMSPAGRNTAYAKALFAPYGADLGRTFSELNSQASRLGTPAIASPQVTQVQPIGSNGPVHCAILTGTANGTQPLQFEGTFCQSQLGPAGGFMNLANLAFAPAQFEAHDRATLRAMLGSFQVNNAIVAGQAAALAKPTVDAVHEIGRQVNDRISVADRQDAERRSSFEQHNDAMDRTSQGFSNYLLEKSVIVDTQNNAHGTLWNDTAAALVKSDPNRFEYVDTPGYWKGIDY
jgi:hypothetical protein